MAHVIRTIKIYEESVFSVFMGYAPIYRGQRAYIKDRCDRKKIRIKIGGGKIYIQRRIDVDPFYGIIDESLDAYKEGPGEKDIPQDQPIIYKHKNKFICLVYSGVLYVSERNLKKLVRLQFTGKIPVILQNKIFDTNKELFHHTREIGIM